MEPRPGHLPRRWTLLDALGGGLDGNATILGFAVAALGMLGSLPLSNVSLTAARACFVISCLTAFTFLGIRYFFVAVRSSKWGAAPWMRMHWRDLRTLTQRSPDWGALAILSGLYAKDEARSLPPVRLDAAEALLTRMWPLVEVHRRQAFTFDLLARADALTHAGYSAQQQADLWAQHKIRTERLCQIVEQVPALTPEDLHRFTGTRVLAAPVRAIASHLNRLYAAHGERASYYATLGMSPAEQDRMTAEQVPLDTLKAMVALTQPASV